MYHEKAFYSYQIHQSEKIFLDSETPKLTDQEKETCEGLITKAECLAALKAMKNNKSPGTDGFGIEFYKFFWSDISSHLLSSINQAFHAGEVSIDQKRGIITLIPKKDKDRIYLKNWRPIALLNSDYKILAKVLANRLKNVITKLVDSDQKGYIKGRYIGENIRTVSDVIHYLKEKNMDAIILLIDFEKAFDSVSWTFIDKALEKFNFGVDYRKWVKTLYTNSESAVLNNGHFTQFFKLGRGVRQGCPLSAYLFLLVVELLACKIRSNSRIQGIPLKNIELKISQMADDTTIFLKNGTSIPVLLDTLNHFSICSGLTTNIEKTKAYKFGPTKIFENSHLFNWETGPIQFLGITITDNIKINIEENFMPKIKLMNNLLKIWSRRNLSLKGKIIIINALIISLFVYPLTILDANEEVLHTINTAIFEFLWNWKKPKIARGVIQNQLYKGGLKMPNIYIKSKAWKLSWLKRAISNKNAKWVLLLDTIIGKISFTHLMYTDFIKDNCAIAKLPQFYQNIFKDWVKNLHNNVPANASDVQNQPLWLNKSITIDNKPLFWQKWYDKGVFFVHHLLNENSEFLTADQIENKFGIECNFLKALQIKQAIPSSWRKKIKKVRTVLKYNCLQIFVEQKVKFINIENISSQMFYWILMGNLLKTPSCIKKWQSQLQTEGLVWKNIFLNPFQVCHESVLQSFQYKVIHRIIPCNHWLNIMNIKDSPLCTFCMKDDDIIHFFVKCDRLSQFWISFEKWWIRVSGDVGLLDIQTIIFGANCVSNHANAFNYCLIVAKMYIYSLKMKTVCPQIDFYNFLIILKDKFIIEETNAILMDKYENFANKFGFVHQRL